MKHVLVILFLSFALFIVGCEGQNDVDQALTESQNNQPKDDFAYQTEQVEDLRILRYKIPGFEELTKKEAIIYYFTNEKVNH